MAGGLICIFFKYIPDILPCWSKPALSDPKSAVSCSCSPCKCAEREQLWFFSPKTFQLKARGDQAEVYGLPEKCTSKTKGKGGKKGVCEGFITTFN